MPPGATTGQLPVCFLMQDRKQVDPNGREVGRTGRREEEETINQDILYKKKNLFSKKKRIKPLNKARTFKSFFNLVISF